MQKQLKISKSIDIYLSWKGLYAPRATIAYKPWLEKFSKVINKPLNACGIEDIIKYNTWLKKKYRPRSVQYAMVILHNFFDFWKKRGENCLSPEFIKIPKAKSTAHETVDEKDFLKILNVLDEKDFWNLQEIVIIRILHDSGMRVGELCNINLSEINSCSAVINSEKTDKLRQIFWSKETNVYVENFLKERIKINNSQAMFVGRYLDGTPSKRLTSRSVQRLVKKLVMRANIAKKITPHSFRHGKAHRILEQGGSVKSVQCILGHQNPISSFVYLQFSDLETQKEAQKYLIY